MSVRRIDKAKLVFHTIKYLRPIQVINRIQRWFLKPKPIAINAKRMPISVPIVGAPNFITREVEFLGNGKVRFLNTTDAFETYRWGKYQQPLLWHYNLHYFNDLRLPKTSKLQHEMIECWVAEVTPGSAIAWDPYPISLRVVNWIQWHLKCTQGGHAGLSENALRSLRAQLMFLSHSIEWHLLGNHLFENAKSLLIGGLFFGGRDADKLRDLGTKILSAEIDEQILEDGAHFELSPMYHALVLEGLLEVIAISNLYPQRQTKQTSDLLSKIDAVIPIMFQWLTRMTHRDGDFSFFNDTAFGVAPTLGDLQNMAVNVGYSIPAIETETESLTASGYCRLENADAVVLADFANIGPDYLPGHAHADTLSIEFSIGVDRIFVNSGTSIYETGKLRSFQRSTAAHNTVEVQHESSSEVWSGFRVARRAKVHSTKLKSSANTISAMASHDGYNRLSPPVTHQRIIDLNDSTLTITDKLDIKSKAVVRYFLHPNCRAKIEDNSSSILVKFGANFGNELKIEIQNADVDLVQSLWYPNFGREMQNQCIKIEPHTAECTIKIVW